ncbi:hypothetical protein HDU93_006749, partial [Gonapodya sp. JEL0774]
MKPKAEEPDAEDGTVKRTRRKGKSRLVDDSGSVVVAKEEVLQYLDAEANTLVKRKSRKPKTNKSSSQTLGDVTIECGGVESVDASTKNTEKGL